MKQMFHLSTCLVHNNHIFHCIFIGYDLPGSSMCATHVRSKDGGRPATDVPSTFDNGLPMTPQPPTQPTSGMSTH